MHQTRVRKVGIPSIFGLLLLEVAFLVMVGVLGCSPAPTPTQPAVEPTIAQPTDTAVTPPTQPTRVAEVLPTDTPTTTVSPIPAPEEPTEPAPSIPTPAPGSLLRKNDMMAMILVPEGPFLMGSDQGDPSAQADEKPQHTVTLDAYWIDKYEVSNAQYTHCVAASACPVPDSCAVGTPNYLAEGSEPLPAVCVSWAEAQAYCEWAGARLPTEAEWEKAARGTDGRIYPWGGEAVCGLFNGSDANSPFIWNSWDRSCTADPYPKAAPVWAYAEGRGPFGLLNMAGNVMEWVSDWYSAAYYESSPEANALGPATGSERGLRGGSWNLSKAPARTARRFKWSADTRMEHYGFRCASSAPVEWPTPEEVVEAFFARFEQAETTKALMPFIDLFAEDAVLIVPPLQVTATGTVSLTDFYTGLIYPPGYLAGVRRISLDKWTERDLVRANYTFTSETVPVPMTFHHVFRVSAGRIRSLEMAMVPREVEELVRSYFDQVQRSADNSAATCQLAPRDLAALLDFFAEDATVEVPALGQPPIVGIEQLATFYPTLMDTYLCGLQGSMEGGVAPIGDLYRADYLATSYAITTPMRLRHRFGMTGDGKIQSLAIEIPPPDSVVDLYHVAAPDAFTTGDFTELLGLFSEGATVEIPSSGRRASGSGEIETLYRGLFDGYLHGLECPLDDRSKRSSDGSNLETVYCYLTSDQIGVPVWITEVFEKSAKGDKIVSLSMDLPDTPEQQTVIRYFALAEQAAADPAGADLGPMIDLFAHDAEMNVPALGKLAKGKGKIAGLIREIIEGLLLHVEGKLDQLAVQGNLVVADYTLRSAALPDWITIRHSFMLVDGKIKTLVIEVPSSSTSPEAPQASTARERPANAQEAQLADDYLTALQQAAVTGELTTLLDLFADNATVGIPMGNSSATGQQDIANLYMQLFASIFKDLQGQLAGEPQVVGGQLVATYQLTSAGMAQPTPWRHTFTLVDGKIQSLIIEPGG